MNLLWLLDWVFFSFSFSSLPSSIHIFIFFSPFLFLSFLSLVSALFDWPSLWRDVYGTGIMGGLGWMLGVYIDGILLLRGFIDEAAGRRRGDCGELLYTVKPATNAAFENTRLRGRGGCALALLGMNIPPGL